LMGRTLWITCLAAVAALAAACGGSSSSSSSAAKLSSGDVAVVGGTHITKSDLDHQIQLELAAMKVKKQAIPQVGTSSYQTSVVQPVLQYLVTDAQVHDIAKTLGVSVTPKDIQAQVQKAITQFYGGSQAKYQADLKKYQLTPTDVAQQFELTLLEQKIESKLKNQVKVTPKQAQDYYNTHKVNYQTGADSRQVDYALFPSKAAAMQAQAAIAGGKSFKDVATGAIDDSSLHEPFVATKGQIDKAFQDAAFSLKTNELSGLVPVDKAYASTSLKGKCKPTCYFVIRPTADVVKGGQQQSFASVKAQIISTLLSQQQSAHLQSVIGKLEKQEKNVTHYAAGYAPPKTPTPSAGGTTSPTT
jgi:parvulin-like peptidyl-prolyl isomerase